MTPQTKAEIKAGYEYASIVLRTEPMIKEFLHNDSWESENFHKGALRYYNEIQEKRCKEKNNA